MCYGGCDCRRCNPLDVPVKKRSAWTSKRPTKAGWYWWRPDYDVEPSPILAHWTQDKSLYCIRFGGREIFMENMGGEWQPVEPAKD